MGALFSRRAVLRLGAAAVLSTTGAVLLSACGSAPATPPPAPTNAPQSAPTSAPAPASQASAPTAASAAAPSTAATSAPAPVAQASTVAKQKITLNMGIHTGAPVPNEPQTALSTAYQQHHPNVDFSWDIQPGSTEDYSTWLGTQEASNDPPDFCSCTYQSNYRNYVDLNQYQYVTNPYTNNQWNDDFDWNFHVNQNAVGQRIQLESQAVHILWFYNQDMFDKVGVQPPKDWNELADICAKISKAGITPVSTNYTYQLPQWITEIYWDQYQRQQMIDAIRAQPGDWNYNPKTDANFTYDPNNHFIDRTYDVNPSREYAALRDKKLRFDIPEMTDMIKNLNKVYPQYAVKDLFVRTAQYPPFIQQQVAIMIDLSSSLSALKIDMANMTEQRRKALAIDPNTKISSFRWSTFENPPMVGPLVKAPVRSVESASGEYAGVIKKSSADQTDTAIDFLMFWFSKVGYQFWVDGYVKSAQWAPSGPIQIKGVNIPKDYQTVFDNIHMLGSAEGKLFSFMGVGGPGSPEKQFTFNLLQQTLQGKVAPEDFGKQVEDMITSKFNDILQRVHLTQEDLNNPQLQPKS